jgi:hypothetical protein
MADTQERSSRFISLCDLESDSRRGAGGCSPTIARRETDGDEEEGEGQQQLATQREFILLHECPPDR